MTVTRDQLRAAMLDDGERTEAVPLDLEDEVRVIERQTPLPHLALAGIGQTWARIQNTSKSDFGAEADWVITLSRFRPDMHSLSFLGTGRVLSELPRPWSLLLLKVGCQDFRH